MEHLAPAILPGRKLLRTASDVSEPMAQPDAVLSYTIEIQILLGVVICESLRRRGPADSTHGASKPGCASCVFFWGGLELSGNPATQMNPKTCHFGWYRCRLRVLIYDVCGTLHFAVPVRQNRLNK